MYILSIENEQERTFLEKLYLEHRERMYHAAYKILHSHNDTEDAIQDTFIKIHRNIEKFYKLQREELCLLIVIYTKNTAKDIYRRRSKYQTVPLTYDEDGEEKDFEIPDESADLDEIVINRERVQKMEALINKLDEEQLHVILLKYRFGMSDKEIADVIGISETAVSSRLSRAKQKLRKMMGYESL